MKNLENILNKIQSAEKTLFILCGYPYSGKTYIAKQIINSLKNIEYVSIDDIFYIHGFDWSTNHLPTQIEWGEIFNESYTNTTKALVEGKNVLYDSTNQTVESRDELRAIAKSVCASAYVIYIETEQKLVWKRWEENLKQNSRSIVNRKLVQMTIDMFEKPTEEESILLIKN